MSDSDAPVPDSVLAYLNRVHDSACDESFDCGCDLHVTRLTAAVHASRALIDALPRCICGAPATKIWTRVDSPRCDNVLCSGALCDDLPYAAALRTAISALRGTP